MTESTEGVKRDALLALEKRVAEAKGPDRELDALIACHFVFSDLRPSKPDDFDGKFGYRLGDIKCEHGFLMSDPYTSSIDAALALVSRVLPDWSWSVEQFPKLRAQLAEPVQTEFGSAIGIRAQVTDAATPALAICLALIRALLRSLTKGAGERHSHWSTPANRKGKRDG